MEILVVVLLVWSEAKNVVADVDSSLNPCKCLTDFFREYLTGGVDTKKESFISVQDQVCCKGGILQLVPIGYSLG